MRMLHFNENLHCSTLTSFFFCQVLEVGFCVPSFKKNPLVQSGLVAEISRAGVAYLKF
jgi:hypothetical protein